ncbi:ribosome biogenesis GTPase Der [bacterium]
MLTVCIVGRTNVGKSTLFNRLAKRRKALVSKVPKLTRDRNYEKINYKDSSYMLIDTGGLEEQDGSFEIEWISKNVVAGIKEASVIIFLVDGLEGMNPVDKDILNMIRKKKKDFIVCVNKIDDESHKNKIADYYSLGISNIKSISAMHGLGIDELQEEIVSRISDKEQEFVQKIDVNIALVGRPNTGKSSLLNAILNKERVLVSDIPGTTRDSIDTYFTRDNKNYCLVDTAGLKRKKRFSTEFDIISKVVCEKSIRRADVVVLLSDASSGIVEQDLRVANIVQEYGKACILAINKWDLISEREEYAKTIIRDIKTLYHSLSSCELVFISAKHGLKIHKIFDLINSVYQQYNKQISKKELKQVFQEMFLKRPPSLTKFKKRTILKDVKQVKTKPPTFHMLLNKMGDLHTNYIRYIEHRLRDIYGFKGTPIKIIWDKKL